MKGAFCLDPAFFDQIYGEEIRQEIASLVDINGPVLSADQIGAQPDLLRDIDVILSGWGAPVFNADLLEHAQNLKAVFYGAGSVKGLVSDPFWQRRVQITSAYACTVKWSPILASRALALRRSLAFWLGVIGVTRLARSCL